MRYSLKLLSLLVAVAPLCTSFAPASITLSAKKHRRYDALHATRKEELLDLETSTSTRRDIILLGAIASLMAVASSAVPTISNAEEEEAAAVVSPNVKSTVTLNLSIARGSPRPLRIEIFQDAPTASVEFFTSLVDGTMKAPCEMGDDPNIEICEEYQSINVGYKNSQMWRLVPNKRMDFGRVDSMFTSRVPPTIAAERNNADIIGIQPSTRGAVSIKRGGGAFEFTVTPSYNPSLDSDREDLVVVGRIAEEDLAFMDEINAITVRKDILKMGDVPPLGAKFARACDFTAPDSTCAQYKPLKKIVVAEISRKD
mmetsp:Transcript_13425/g.19777  ORF Transcript_13425/g.19777 Transcript_13425/m.19777 type:complete len:313 (+) Transcript_13425:94-1032(+)